MGREYYKTENTGRVVYRIKSGFIKHTGLVIGSDRTGQTYVIHKYPEKGVVEETWEEFAQGQSVYYDSVECIYDVEEVVRRAFEKLGEKWDLHVGNCQQFTNHACRDEHKSDTWENLGRALLAIAAVVVVVVGFVALVALFFGDKAKTA